MPGSFWKITALVGVLGLGCLIVMQAQKGMSSGTSSSDDSFEDFDAAFDKLASEDDALDDASADDSAQDTLATGEQADADEDSGNGLLWEPTPVESVSSGDPFADQPATADAVLHDEDSEDDDLQLAGVVNDASDDDSDDEIQLASNDAPWATGGTGSSIPSTASPDSGTSGASSSSGTAGRSPFLLLPASSVDETSSESDDDEPNESSSSAGPALQSMPSHFTSPALLPTPSGDTEEASLQEPGSSSFANDDVQFFPAGPDTQLPRTRQAHQEYRELQAAQAAAETESSGSDAEVTTNPFAPSSSSVPAVQPASNTPRTLSFPAGSGGSSGNAPAISPANSSDPFASTSDPATSGTNEPATSSSIPGGSSSQSNPFLPTDVPATTSDAGEAPAPIRMSIPGRASLDDPAPTSDAPAQEEPTPAIQPSNTPVNPFPLTTNPRPIDQPSDAGTTTPAPRISFPSVNPSSNPAASNPGTPPLFPSSLPSTSQPPSSDPVSDPANPFAQTADAPASSVPSPFPSTVPAPTTDAPEATYAGDGTVEGVVSSSHQPELQIQKVAPPQAIVGEFLIYEIHVRNVGQSAAHDVVIEDRIPLGSDLKGTIPRAELVGTQLLWRLGTMEPGAEEIIKVRVVPTAAGEIGSVATVSFAAEVAATTIVTAPALSVDMTGPNEMALGEEGAYHFVIRNDGDGEARDVVIVAMLPEGLAHPGGQELEYAVGNVAPGEVRTADIVLTAASSGPVSPRAQVTINGQVHDEAGIDINLLESRIEVRRQGPIRRFVGRPATYTNVVTNLSSQPLENIAVVEAIPHGLDLASIPEGGRFDPLQRTITWTVASLEPHQSLEFRSSIVAAQEGEWEGSLVASDAAGNRAQLATQIDVAGFSSLLVDVEHAGQPVLVGEQVSLRLTVRNAGTAAARGVQAVVEVPAELEFVTAQGPVGHSIEGSTVTFESIEGLDVSGEQSFDIVFTAAARGDARVRVSLISADLENPIVQEQAVRIFDEN